MLPFDTERCTLSLVENKAVCGLVYGQAQRGCFTLEPQLMCHYYMQAILLYRDPTGERVFDGTDPTKQADSSEMRDSYYNDRAVGMPELTDAERVTSQVARLKEKMEQIISRKIAELEAIVKS